MKQNWLNRIFLSQYFFAFGAALVLILAFGFSIPILFTVGKVGIVLLILLVVVDAVLLYLPSNNISLERIIPNRIGLDDPTPVKLVAEIQSGIELNAEILDELPFQLQERHFSISTEYNKGISEFHYVIHPKSRGK